ncbi:MAG: nuclear transport factor 2 family protein [Alphaproteobacteria bacterium]|nr:nuclear transport factor 2 family protein [Alphaproteobacteria bacterium]
MGKAIALAAALASASELTASAQTPETASTVAVLSPTASEAAMAVDAFHTALGRKDTTSAAALLSDNALIFEGGYVERSKVEYASHHLGADAAYASAVPTSLVRRSGFADGDMAWIASETRSTGTYKDKPVDRLSTETMVLKKEASGWRIVHIHWSSRAAS